MEGKGRGDGRDDGILDWDGRENFQQLGKEADPLLSPFLRPEIPRILFHRFTYHRISGVF